MHRGSVQVLEKLTFGIVPGTPPLPVCIFFFGGQMVRVALGEKFEPVVALVQVLSLLPLIIGLCNVFGGQGLINLKRDSQFLTPTVIGSILSAVLNFALDLTFKKIGAASSWLITELFITTALYFELHKAKINAADFSFYKRWLLQDTDGADVSFAIGAGALRRKYAVACSNLFDHFGYVI